jgi:cysteine-rich repeat protein
MCKTSCALLVGVLAACTSGGSVDPMHDKGPPRDGTPIDGTLDTGPGQDEGPLPDEGPPPDEGPTPDKGPPTDKGPKPDTGPCGNGKVDPNETCDKAIAAGKAGACAQSAADCDDQNACTTDSVTGSAAACTAECVHTPVPSCCGNGVKEGSEACDDGNTFDSDGCSNQCKLPGGHLLLTEVATSPVDAEFVEIYNPSTVAVALDGYYLADRNDYFLVVDSLPGASTDFVARFPAGASIGPGEFRTVAVDGLKFKIAFGKAPDFELKSTDSAVADMLAPASKAIGSQAGLTDGGELVMLFHWDGAADLVKDVDYTLWHSSTTPVNKSAICVDGPDADSTTSCYLSDAVQQGHLDPPQQGGSLHRCDYLEGSEKASGGNGLLGHDETSEPLGPTGGTWKRNLKTPTLRTPGGPAPAGFCP